MQKTVKHLFILIFIGVLVFLITNSLFGHWNFTSQKSLYKNMSWNVLYSIVLGGGNMCFFYFLSKIKWKDEQFAQRVIIGVLGSIPITIIAFFFLNMFVMLFLKNHSFGYFITHQKIGNYVFGVLISLFAVIIFHAFYFFKMIQERKVKDSQIVAKTETAKFESLKNQLDPHFLFNSLNVLTGLIEENPQGAVKFTTGLSKVYRYILEQKDKDLVLVADEIKFAKSYVQLLKTRFEEGIEFEIEEGLLELDVKIIPLSLQLLLENAVKHNRISSEEPLRIKIYKEVQKLVIENSFNPKRVIEKSTKVGLQNIKERYSLVSNEMIEVVQSENLFSVKLPLLTKNIKKMETGYINETEKYLVAKKRAEDVTNFYTGLVAYFIVIPFLIYINYTTNWRHQWFWYPLLGWGFGIIMNAFNVFGLRTSWQNKKIKEYMNKM